MGRLAADLAADGQLAELDERTGHVLVRLDSQDEQPVRLVFTDEELQELLRRVGNEGAEAVFPGTGPLQAAYQLFLVHLYEALATEAVPGTEMSLSGGGLVLSPRQDIAPRVPAVESGDIEFMSFEQYRAG